MTDRIKQEVPKETLMMSIIEVPKEYYSSHEHNAKEIELDKIGPYLTRMKSMVEQIEQKL